MDKLKRVVIKEELVALTGNFKSAILLNQMIYWSERTKDFDKFIQEEAERVSKDGETIGIKPSNGWIYKTSDELSEETMIGLSVSNIRKYLKELVANGWLDERTNPTHKWDRTLQYRVNIIKIQMDLLKLGYNLEGYPFSKIENAISKIENGGSILENRNFILENRTEQNRKAIPEITTENTLKITFEEEIAPVILEFSKAKDKKPTLKEKEILSSLTAKYSTDLVLKAISITVEQAREVNLKYIRTVLEDWDSKGLITLQQVESHITSENNANKKARNNRRSVVNRKAKEENIQWGGYANERGAEYYSKFENMLNGSEEIPEDILE